MAAADAVEMFVALMGYTGSVHPGQLPHVDEVLAAAHAALAGRGGLTGDLRAERQLVALLSVPLTKWVRLWVWVCASGGGGGGRAWAEEADGAVLWGIVGGCAMRGGA